MLRSVAYCVVCMCVVGVLARPAPPARKSDNNESKMLPEETIIIRRLPNSYNYPFSLWPMPKWSSGTKVARAARQRWCTALHPIAMLQGDRQRVGRERRACSRRIPYPKRQDSQHVRSLGKFKNLRFGYNKR